jgi:hypothetical protein
MGAKSECAATFAKLDDGLCQASDWHHWRPLLSERQWGTVREDFTADVAAWTFFNQHFHGDNGAGLGACHQTGWTGVIIRRRRATAAALGDILPEVMARKAEK